MKRKWFATGVGKSNFGSRKNLALLPRDRAKPAGLHTVAVRCEHGGTTVGQLRVERVEFARAGPRPEAATRS